MCQNVRKWLKKGVRLERREYVTVESLTLDGFWARQDNGDPVWIPMSHLGVKWNKLKVRLAVALPKLRLHQGLAIIGKPVKR